MPSSKHFLDPPLLTYTRSRDRFSSPRGLPALRKNINNVDNYYYNARQPRVVNSVYFTNDDANSIITREDPVEKNKHRSDFLTRIHTHERKHQ